MQLKVLGSNSSGNCYILQNHREALIIECGIHIDKIKQALGFNLMKVAGAVLSHCHNDHSKSAMALMGLGINVWTSEGTIMALNAAGKHRAKRMISGTRYLVGNFSVMPFDVKHDCPEPFGFLISHAETGTILFLTDSYYTEYKFKGLNHVMIEANYCESIIDARMSSGEGQKFLRDRTIESHMSIQTCLETLKANDLSNVNNILLIHLSDSNSDEARFKKEVQQATGKQVHVASSGLTIDLNKNPF